MRAPLRECQPMPAGTGPSACGRPATRQAGGRDAIRPWPRPRILGAPVLSAVLTSVLTAVLTAVLAVVLAVVLAACGSSALYGVPGAEQPSPAPARPYNVSGLLKPAAGKFLGAQAPGAPDSLGPVRSFAAAAGARPDLVGEYMSWGDPLDTQAVINAWSYGALYYMVWEPYHTTVAAIADGRSNGYITRVARQVRALNMPVAISFGHEMNGFWYPWGTTGTTAAYFVAAWRLIHRLFTAADARNVIWVWNPNVISAEPQLDLGAYYPGDAYVNWVGITGYFAATGPDTFDSLYGPTMQEIRGFTAKPFIIAETSVQTGTDAVAAAQSLVDGVRQHPDVLGFVWFDYDKGGVDWRLESRPPLRAALAAGIARLRLINVRRP
jgi:mannan endo-1,4-beta-mannosidase